MQQPPRSSRAVPGECQGQHIGDEGCGDLDAEIQNLLEDGELLLTPRPGEESSRAPRPRDPSKPEDLLLGDREGRRVPSRPTTAQADELVCEEMSRARYQGGHFPAGISGPTSSPFGGGLPVLDEVPRPTTAQAEQLISEEIRIGFPRGSPGEFDPRRRGSGRSRPQNPHADLLVHEEEFRPSNPQGADEMARPSTAQVEALIREEFRNHQHLSLDSMAQSGGVSPASAQGCAVAGVGGSSSSFASAGVEGSARSGVQMRPVPSIHSSGSPSSSGPSPINGQLNGSRPSTAQVEQLVSEEMGFLRPWPERNPNIPVPDLLELMDVSGRQATSLRKHPAALRAAAAAQAEANNALSPAAAGRQTGSQHDAPVHQRLAASETLAELPQADGLVVEEVDDHHGRENRPPSAAEKRLSELFKDILGG